MEELICRVCRKPYETDDHDVQERCPSCKVEEMQEELNEVDYSPMVKNFCIVGNHLFANSLKNYWERGNCCIKCDVQLDREMERRMLIENILLGRIKTPANISEHRV